MVSSEISLNVLDLTLLLVDGFIQTDIYSKPTDHHIYLQHNSAHPSHSVPKLSHLVLLPGFAKIVPQSKNLKNVVKSIRSILLIGVTALLKLNNNLKRPKIHPGRTSLHLNCEREKLFSRWQSISIHICQISAKLLSHIAISFMTRLLQHKFFLKSQSFRPIDGQKTSRSFQRDPKDPIIVRETILSQVVLSVARNAIYVGIIWTKIRSSIANAPIVIIVSDNISTVNRRM